MTSSRTCYKWWYWPDMSPNEAMAELEWFSGGWGMDVEYDIHDPYALVYGVPRVFMEDLVRECGGRYDV